MAGCRAASSCGAGVGCVSAACRPRRARTCRLAMSELNSPSIGCSCCPSAPIRPSTAADRSSSSVESALRLTSSAVSSRTCRQR
eukprot:3144962-Prymnesium_polylepis.1